MITRRYAKLFQSLNKTLETRVKEIDRPAMRLAEIRKSMVFDRLINDSSALFSVSAEALPLAQTALSGKLKQKTKETLNTLTDVVYESRSYSEKVDSILIKNELVSSGEGDKRFIPAVFFVTDSLINTDGCIENVYTAEADVWQNTAPVVSEINLVQKDLRWAPADNEEKTVLRNEFLALCEKESGEKRIVQEMIRLFDESAWEDCRNELQ